VCVIWILIHIIITWQLLTICCIYYQLCSTVYEYIISLQPYKLPDSRWRKPILNATKFEIPEFSVADSIGKLFPVPGTLRPHQTASVGCLPVCLVPRSLGNRQQSRKQHVVQLFRRPQHLRPQACLQPYNVPRVYPVIKLHIWSIPSNK